jgi:hypothetical protein
MTGHMDVPDTTSNVGRGGRPALVPAAVLTLIAGALLFWTTRLPFTAGSQAIDLLVPVGAVAGGAAGVVLAVRARGRGEDTAGAQALPVIIAILAALVTIAALLSLVAIFGLCGLYWTRTSC